MFAGFDGLDGGVDPGEIDPGDWLDIDDTSQYTKPGGLSGIGLQQTPPPKKPEEPKKAATFGPKHLTDILGGVTQAAQRYGQAEHVASIEDTIQQLNALRAQKQITDQAYNEQIRALQSRPGFQPSFVSRYGILLVVGGVLVAGGVYFLMRKRRRRQA